MSMMGTSINIRMGLKVFQKGEINNDDKWIFTALLPRAPATDLHLIGLDHKEALQIWEETVKNTKTDSTSSVLI